MTRDPRHPVWAFRLAAMAALCLVASQARSQSASAPTVPATDVFGVGELLFASDPLENQDFGLSYRPTRNPGPMPVADWLLYPTIDVGAIYDDNLYTTRSNKIADIGLRIRPTIVATRNTGIQNTTVYASADARAFKDNPRVDSLLGTVGVTHRYEIERDLVARFQAEYDHRADDYGQALASDTLRGGLVPPVQYDQIYLSSSIRKDFSEFFSGLGASYQNTTFNVTKDSLGNVVDESYRNEADIRVMGRLGYKFSPALYSFVEPSLIWQQFNPSEFNTHGYRVVAGLGSERISLFSGEIFGGFQSQDFDRTGSLAGEGPVFGGRISWSPTRDIVVTAIAEHAIGLSTLSSGLNRLNTGIGLDPTFQSNILTPLQQVVSKTTSVGLQASYALTRELSADAAAGYQTTRDSGQSSDLISAQIGLKYMLLRNLGLRLDYAYSAASASGEPLFTRNRVTMGVFGQL